MASSSNSSVPKSFKYDVFLSFRGEDTRKNFIDHLYHALQEKNIHTYKDDERINKGKRISDELMGSIEDSKFFIIVFSKTYASSSWCLKELLKIMECNKTTEQTVYPVFYDVEPSEVRNQTGAVGEAFARHEKEEAAGKWRKALKEAGEVAGWELKNTADGHEAKLIRQIVEKLSLELRAIDAHTDKNLVGMETRINDIVSSLETDSDEVHMIGIWGMGGGGKTTLARAVFNKLSFEFQGKKFIENVREVSKASVSGLNSLKSQVPLNGGKVLLVLDDVDHLNQLQVLAGDTSWFKTGSIIIITTRDEQHLVAHRVKLIHNINLLSKGEAFCLFSRYAFGRELPIQGYEELSGQVVRYAAGLPLTLKVLGSSLCGKSKPEWKDAIARLEKIPEKEIQEQLEVSYTSLDNEQKEMFLDVATMMKHWKKNSVIKALQSCGFYAVIGLRVLEQRSLITIDDYGFVGMHDQLEEMGKNIVRRDMPNKRSRLWDSMEIEDILATDQGTEATRCINFSYKGKNPEIIMQGFRKMKELRFLYLTMGPNPLSREIDKCSPYFPDALRYLRLYEYPFRSLPKGFDVNNLVGIKIEYSDIVQLWEGGEKKVLKNLRFLQLMCPKLRFFDLGLTPNLETFMIQGDSDDLLEVHMPVECTKLRSLRLYFVKLRTLDLRLTPNLEKLHLNHCSDFQQLHMGDGCLKLEYLGLLASKVRTFGLGPSPNLERLNVVKCDDLEEFHIAECPILTYIRMNCSKLRTLDLRLAPNLSYISLTECKGLVELHLPTKCLNLTSIEISYSKARTLVLGLTPNLTHLYLNNCYDLEELHLADNCQELVSLDISFSRLIRTLSMVDQCQKLISLNIRYSNMRTLDLGLTPNIETLKLEGCKNLVELHAPIGCLKNIVYLDLTGCLRFSSFLFHIRNNTSGIVYESLDDRPLAKVDFELEMYCTIHPETNLPKFQSVCFYEDDLPSLRRSIEKLISEGPCACTKIKIFEKEHVPDPQLRHTLMEDEADQPTTGQPTTA